MKDRGVLRNVPPPYVLRKGNYRLYLGRSQRSGATCLVAFSILLTRK
ncbi:hypothetical protein HMPREF1869_01681 [Bacteroidales bacterium KA00251]|nr:hypothetical protein HMPREF1869_01681 [Bacteroidales bacterium KA00251]